MRTFVFDIFFRWQGTADVEFLDTYEASIFEAFHGDVTPGVRAGEPYVSCVIESQSLEAAIRLVQEALKKEGLQIKRLEMGPEQVESLEVA